MKQAGNVGKFVGTVTDKSFLQAVEKLQDATSMEKLVYVTDIREGVIEYLDVICAVAVWQMKRIYWDEVKYCKGVSIWGKKRSLGVLG